MELQSNLKRLRKARGLSLNGVAVLVGISKTQVWHFEQAKCINPTLKTLIGFCKAFNVTILELLYEKELLKNTDTI